MDIRHHIPGGSPSSSSTTTSSSSQTHNPITTSTATTSTTTTTADPMHSWWESISKARSRIQLLSKLIPDPNPISSLADSDSPANSLLSSFTAYDAVSTSLLSSPVSGSGSDLLCNWLYDTFLSSDQHLSRSGIYFRTCKDVAFYLRDQSLIDVEGGTGQMNNGSRMLLKPQISEVSNTCLHEVNNNLAATNDLYDVEVSSFIDCSPCGITFEVMGDLEKHLAIFHKETTRRFNLPTTEGTMLCTSDEHVDMEHDEPRLDEAHNQQNGQASSSSLKMAEPQEPVPIINGKFKTKCTWCYKEFLCEAVDAETMAEAIGFMCPKCKRKVSGVLEKSCQGLVNNKFVG